MTHSNGIVGLLLLAALAAPLACSSNDKVNIGNTAGASGMLVDYVATWQGHAEAYAFGADGSDAVRLTMNASGEGALVFGDTTLPPASDPNVGYPPGVADIGFAFNSQFLFEGFAYPTHAARVEAGRLQFGVNGYDVFAGWCALQTPILQGQTTGPDGSVQKGYGCVPSSASTGPLGAGDAGTTCALVAADGSVTATVDCGKLFLCNSLLACTCTESSCTARQAAAGTLPAQYPISWDAGLDSTGTVMTATLVVNGMRITVHLTRD